MPPAKRLFRAPFRMRVSAGETGCPEPLHPGSVSGRRYELAFRMALGVPAVLESWGSFIARPWMTFGIHLAFLLTGWQKKGQ